MIGAGAGGAPILDRGEGSGRSEHGRDGQPAADRLAQGHEIRREPDVIAARGLRAGAAPSAPRR